MRSDDKDEKVIERFEDIFENNEEKLRNTILLDNNMKNLHILFKDRGRKSIKLADFIYHCQTHLTKSF